MPQLGFERDVDLFFNWGRDRVQIRGSEGGEGRYFRASLYNRERIFSVSSTSMKRLWAF